jgi:POT family proton-dependent oligopeptide transporter
MYAHNSNFCEIERLTIPLAPDNQMSNNIVSQAGSMSTHGVPNDLLQNIDPIAIIIIIPLMDRIV